MKRNIVAAICVLLAVTFIFASCTKNNTYKDKDGNSYIPYTNDNGETVTDSEGAVIVIPTDTNGDAVTRSNGEFATQTVPVPGINVSSSGKKVDCKAYSLSIPDGWVLYTGIDDYAQLRLGDEDSDVKMDIRYYSEGYDTVLELAKEIKKSFVEGVEEVIEDSEEEVKLSNKNGEISPVTKLTFIGKSTVESKKVVAGFVYYIFKAGGYTYGIPCTALSEDALKNTDFEAVINVINFKN